MPSLRLETEERARRRAYKRQLARDAHAGFLQRPGTARVQKARAKLCRLLWNANGERALPGTRALDEALSGLPEEELSWLFELSPLAPLYLLPTRRFVNALARELERLCVRRVVEVGAGDGFLSRALRRAAPKIEIIATDSGAWEVPAARMTRGEQKKLRNVEVPGLKLDDDVLRLPAAQAIKKLAPDLVLASWLVPGRLLDSLITANVSYVLEIGAGSGVTGDMYSWRFAHEFYDDTLDKLARCRLDVRPHETLHSRVTLYYGKKHPEHYEERVQKGDFLWQFRPKKSAVRHVSGARIRSTPRK